MFRRTTLRGCGVDLNAHCFPYHYPQYPPCPTPFPMHQVQTHGAGFQQTQAGVAYPVRQEAPTTQRPFRGGKG